MMNDDDLEAALTALGELLADRQQPHDVAVIGGGALLLLGLIDRPTKDLDVVARIEGSDWLTAEPLPAALASAILDVAAILGLPNNWLNGGPTELLRFGLPEGFDQRTELRTYGALTIRLAARVDQVAFKLYAAVDQGPGSRHFKDLKKLTPTPDELLTGAKWCRTHDPSEGFKGELLKALAALGIDVDDV